MYGKGSSFFPSGMNKRDCPFSLPYAAAVIMFVLAGCEPGEYRSSPGEILHTVEIPDPSILGYVRADEMGLQAIASRLEGFREDTMGLPGASLLVASLPFDMLSKVASLTREGSQITVVLLDPETFGGAAALHFVPDRPGSLVKLLDADPVYKRAGESPAEYRLVREIDPAREILKLLSSAGIDIDIPLSEGGVTFLVEDDCNGTLVLPSFDARRDVKAFLESTDYLGPWGDAGLVVDLDINRLSAAYAVTLRSLDRSIRTIAQELDAAADEKIPIPPGRILVIWSVTVFSMLGGMDAVRYVSAMPGTGESELRILTAEGKCLDRVVQVLEAGGPDQTGAVPGLVSAQLKSDPEKMVRLFSEGASFYTSACGLKEGVLDPLVEAIVRSFAFDDGEYMLGGGVSGQEIWTALYSGVAEEILPAELNGMQQKTWTAFSRLFGAEGSSRLLPSEKLSGSYSVLCCVQPKSGRVLESATFKGHRVTVLRNESGWEPGELPVRLLRRAGIGAPPRSGIPAEACFYVRFSPKAVGGNLLAAAMPVTGIILPEIVGFGRREGRELVIRFPGGSATSSEPEGGGSSL